MPAKPVPEPDDELSDEAVRGLADHLTAALEAYLETHLPPPDAPPHPDGLTPKAIPAGITLFHAGFLVDIAREVFTEAAPTFFKVQVRNFTEALDELYAGDEADGETG